MGNEKSILLIAPLAFQLDSLTVRCFNNWRTKRGELRRLAAT
jgi:hypothetical protein